MKKAEQKENNLEQKTVDQAFLETSLEKTYIKNSWQSWGATSTETLFHRTVEKNKNWIVRPAVYVSKINTSTTTATSTM